MELPGDACTTRLVFEQSKIRGIIIQDAANLDKQNSKYDLQNTVLCPVITRPWWDYCLRKSFSMGIAACHSGGGPGSVVAAGLQHSMAAEGKGVAGGAYQVSVHVGGIP